MICADSLQHVHEHLRIRLTECKPVVKQFLEHLLLSLRAKAEAPVEADADRAPLFWKPPTLEPRPACRSRDHHILFAMTGISIDAPSGGGSSSVLHPKGGASPLSRICSCRQARTFEQCSGTTSIREPKPWFRETSCAISSYPVTR